MIEDSIRETIESSRGNSNKQAFDNPSLPGLRENRVVAVMQSMDHWQGSKIPPNEPWFQGSAFTNFLHYTDPNGTTHALGWEPLK